MKNSKPTTSVTKQHLLAERDRMAAELKDWQNTEHTVLTLKTVTPGLTKSSPLTKLHLQLFNRLIHALICPLETKHVLSGAGDVFFYHVAGVPQALKKLTIYIEENHPLGRFIDLDVYDKSDVLSRPKTTMRRCFLCALPAHHCTRARTHTVAELSSFVKQSTATYLIDVLTHEAYESLVKEACLEPKFGLVTPSNAGAHNDMDFSHFMASADALKLHFRHFVQAGCELEHNLTTLREKGLLAEQAMLQATGGINTHKGAIFIFGAFLPFYMDGILTGKSLTAIVKSMASWIGELTKNDFAKLDDRQTLTSGEKIYKTYGLKGIRGEVAKGFPSLFSWYGKKNYNDYEKLVAIMAHLDDTTIIKRHNYRVLIAVQQDMLALLEESTFSMAHYLKLSDDFKARGISPGGAADVLSLAFFLDKTDHLLLERM